MKKSGGKRKGRKKKARPPPDVEEEEKFTEEQYKAIISDLEQKYEQLKSNCIELEMKNQEEIEKLEQLDEDRNDIVEHLDREINRRDNEIVIQQEHVDKILADRKENTRFYLEKIEFVRNELKSMKQHFSSIIQHLQSKIHAYNELRQQRDDLMRKFELQEEQIKLQLLKQKEILYEAEKKFIVERDQLKNEMREKLFALGQEFRNASSIRIAAITQGAIKENVVLNNNYHELTRKTHKLIKENEALKKRWQSNQVKLSLYLDESNQVFSAGDKQKQVIDLLSSDYNRMMGNYGWAENRIKVSAWMEEKTKRIQNEICNKVKMQERLQEELKQAKQRTGVVDSEMLTLRNYVDSLHKTTDSAVKRIKSVINLDKTESMEELDEFETMEQVLTGLVKTLCTIRSLPETCVRPSVTEITTPEFMVRYGAGDLGLVPTMGSAELHLIYDTPAEEDIEQEETSSSTSEELPTPLEDVKIYDKQRRTMYREMHVTKL